MPFFTDDELCLDRMFDPAQTLFGNDLYFDWHREETLATKRARIAKMAKEIPTPETDKEPF